MDHSPKILLVEDEHDLAEPLRQGLREEGFTVEIAPTGQAAVRRFEEHWDLVVLDLGLPDIPGEAVLNCLKQKPEYPPVLILTARSGVQDKLALFRLGCDDFLAKPVIFEELVERARALIRRSHRVVQNANSYLDLKLNLESLTLVCDTGSVLLTPKEAKVLQFLLENRHRIVSRRELSQYVWGQKEPSETNFVDVHLFNLRKKLSELYRGEWLQTVRSMGVCLAKPDEERA